jgi:xanthine dehydrogenase YagS FAD-binding subunit
MNAFHAGTPGVGDQHSHGVPHSTLHVRLGSRPWAGAQFYFEKVRERQVWDFPIVNVAAVIAISGGKIDRSRIVVNAVAAHPMRLTSVEVAIAGKPRNEETAAMAGELAVQGAQPLAHNGYKIPLVRNLVKRAIRGQTA